jgi:hypothetical protein
MAHVGCLGLIPAVVPIGLEVCLPPLGPGDERGPLGVGEDELRASAVLRQAQPDTRGAYRPLEAISLAAEAALAPLERRLGLGQC